MKKKFFGTSSFLGIMAVFAILVISSANVAKGAPDVSKHATATVMTAPVFPTAVIPDISPTLTAVIAMAPDVSQIQAKKNTTVNNMHNAANTFRDKDQVAIAKNGSSDNTNIAANTTATGIPHNIMVKENGTNAANNNKERTKANDTGQDQNQQVKEESIASTDGTLIQVVQIVQLK